MAKSGAALFALCWMNQVALADSTAVPPIIRQNMPPGEWQLYWHDEPGAKGATFSFSSPEGFRKERNTSW